LHLGLSAQSHTVAYGQLRKGEQLLKKNRKGEALKLLADVYYGISSEDSSSEEYIKAGVLYAQVLEVVDENEATLDLIRKLEKNPKLKQEQYLRLLLTKARLYEKIGDAEATQKNLSLFRSAYQSGHDVALYTDWLIRSASYHRIFGNQDSARFYTNKALESSNLTNNFEGLGQAFLLKAFLETDPKKQIRLLKASLEVWRNNKDSSGTGFMYGNLQRSYKEASIVDTANMYLDSMGYIAVATKYPDLKRYYFQKRAQFFKDTMQFDSALHYVQLAHEAELEWMEENDANKIFLADKRLANHQLLEQISEQQQQLHIKSELEQERNRYLLFTLLLFVLLMILTFLYLKHRKQSGLLREKESKLSLKNQALKDSLRRNELLVGEVHHRVKNNLQFILSIVAMQGAEAKSIQEQNALESLSSRIQAIALVHNNLYESADLERLTLKAYLTQIAENLKMFSAYPDLKFRFDIAEVSLDISRTIALGMISSELITNSLKHAFQDRHDPKITISLQYRSGVNEVRYVYRDNGTFKNSKSTQSGFGHKLVDMFVEKLNGKAIIADTVYFSYDLYFSLRN
jgi:two-component sensor histidine kinase